MPYTIALLAPSPVPFQMGGAEKSLWALREALGELSGCWVELLKMPVGEDTFPDIMAAYESFSQLDLSHFDALITTKYPAWMAFHRHHLVYMYHPLRGVYDTYKLSGCAEQLPQVPTALLELFQLLAKPLPTRADLPLLFDLCRHALTVKSLPSSIFKVPGPLIRSVVHFMDGIALARDQISGYFALSHTVANRPGYFPQAAEVQVINLPTHLPGLHCGGSEYFFTASRLTSSKRIDLIIEAMQYVREDIPLKIAGTGPELSHLQELAATDKRIELLGAVSDGELVQLYAHALAVPFVPLDEDYGLITVEALKSGKPVVTTTDAGGPCELIRHEKNGLIVPPSAAAIGSALQKIALHRHWAKELGQNGATCVAHLNWSHVAKKLMAGTKHSQRKIVLVIAPYGADQHGSGGARRLFHLCRELGQSYEVKLVAYGPIKNSRLHTRNLAPHVHEHLIPWPDAARTQAIKLSGALLTSADDMVLAKYGQQDKIYLETVAKAGKNAAFIVLVHPWLMDAVTSVFPELPLVYDAQNVEADLKLAIHGQGELAELAKKMENATCQKARVILGCSNEDLQRLQQLYSLRFPTLLLLPNGCQPVAHRMKKAALRKRLPYANVPLILFIGSGHKPNVDAALAIFDIAAKISEAQFLLAGSVCGEAPVLNAQKPANAHLLDVISENVKNILLEACDMALNPITGGSGTNLKMVEYLAAGLESISTPFGMRGIPELPGVHVVPLEEFPRTIRQVLAAPAPAPLLEETAATIQTQFAWSTLFANLCPTLANFLDLSHAADH